MGCQNSKPKQQTSVISGKDDAAEPSDDRSCTMTMSMREESLCETSSRRCGQPTKTQALVILDKTPLTPITCSESSVSLGKLRNLKVCEIYCDHNELDEAKCDAQMKQRPILCFEAEVPVDCEPLNEVLSHPLIVEAAESLFVTLLKEPRRTATKVYQALRVMDENGADLVDAVEEETFSLLTVVSAMIEGLKACCESIPNYLQLLQEEEEGRFRILPDGSVRRIDRQAVFGMTDSRIGEVEFGGLDGVLATRAGFVERRRVVQVTYNSSRLPYCNLTRFALQRGIGSVVYYETNEERVAAMIETRRVDSKSQVEKFVGTIQPDFDPKHALRQTMLRYVPLSDLQSTRANCLVDRGVFNEAMHLLSPRQGKILMGSIMKRSSPIEYVDVPIARAWKSRSDLCS